jgi:hypothetical protein
MCTVTYIPSEADQFILTSNRDESAQRVSSVPEFHLAQKQQLVFPADPKSGGSWIATAPNDRTACLLNGAFEKHKHQPPYKRSRGLVLLDSFQYADATAFIDDYDFSGIEPFTLVFCRPNELCEIRWDQQKIHALALDPTLPHIWSSSTLYEPSIRDQRAQWFSTWLSQNLAPELDAIMDFHRFGGEEDLVNGLVMNRNNLVQTLSITAVHKQSSNISMHHLDLLNEQQTQRTMAINHESVATS